MTAIFQAMGEVFARLPYALLAIAVAGAVFILTTWLPNLGLLWQVMTSDAASFADRVTLVAGLTASIGTNFTLFSATSAIVVAILFGVNAAMITYHLRARRRLTRQIQGSATAASFGGLASGIFGVGCAACGMFVLSPALTFLGLGSMVPLLPFGGEEFSALGVGMLALSLILTARRIVAREACPISIPSMRAAAGEGEG